MEQKEKERKGRNWLFNAFIFLLARLNDTFERGVKSMGLSLEAVKQTDAPAHACNPMIVACIAQPKEMEEVGVYYCYV